MAQRQAILVKSLRDVQMASLSGPIAPGKATNLPGGPFGPRGKPFGRPNGATGRHMNAPARTLRPAGPIWKYRQHRTQKWVPEMDE